MKGQGNAKCVCVYVCGCVGGCGCGCHTTVEKVQVAIRMDRSVVLPCPCIWDMGTYCGYLCSYFVQFHIIFLSHLSTHMTAYDMKSNGRLWVRLNE